MYFPFFSNYLVGWKTQYLWNSFSSNFFNVDVGIGQGSCLLPILSALYLSPILYIFEKRAKNLKIPVSFLLFVDNGLFILQEKSFERINSILFYSYNIISSLFKQFGLVIKHGKTKVFHFSRSHRPFNPPLLDLSHTRDPVLYSKKFWQYLEFFFDRKLSF